VNGTCTPACANRYASCDANPVNGCETSLTTLTDCAACGAPCSRTNATASCSTGACTLASCLSGFSTCDSNDANGCEISHATNPLTCGAAEYVGSACGDKSCNLFCRGTSWRTFATRSGRTSKWFRARINECSDCPAALTTRITLSVPPTVDYDLRVYLPCGTLIGGSSSGGIGATDQVTIELADGWFGGDDSFDYWVEVVYYGGRSCSDWTLTFEGRDC